MTPRETAHEDEPHLRRFQALYRAEFAFVWSAAQHFGVAAGTVDDVVQEVFLTAYRRLDQLHFEVSPRAWLFGVTRRVAFRHRRGAARLARRHAAFAELARPQAAAPQQRHDDAQLLTRVLGELADGTRSVWEMTELLGMSAPEIASELGLPLNTVYSRLRLARQQLQALVASDRLESLRDATRQRQAPPREAESRTWGFLLPVLGKPGAAVGLTAWVSTQTAAATTMIVAGAATVGLVVAREPARAADRSPTAAQAPVIAAAKEPAGAPSRRRSPSRRRFRYRSRRTCLKDILGGRRRPAAGRHERCAGRSERRGRAAGRGGGGDRSRAGAAGRRRRRGRAGRGGRARAAVPRRDAGRRARGGAGRGAVPHGRRAGRAVGGAIAGAHVPVVGGGPAVRKVNRCGQ
ncbi:RNA polymerase sigma factor [Nannocystis pusilla]|uniref:RNA polymerase sigma factor n=1 Tax=Nannocystis pusilla TaxID=889268 RepID=UPI003B7603BE